MRVDYRVGFIILSSLVLTSCNMFGFMDSPSGDAQILAAARACFDEGDFQCAANHYAQLSNNSQDEKISEEAFLAMARAGASMTNMLSTFVQGGSGGVILTRMANTMGSSRGSTARLALLSAYRNYSTIDNTRLQNLVRFLTSFALLAELLAEEADTAGNLLPSDFADSPTQCASDTAGNLFANCAKTSATIQDFTGGTAATLTTDSTDAEWQTPNMSHILAVIQEVTRAISGLGLGGTTASINSALNTFNNLPIGLGAQPVPGSRGIRQLLINQGIGTR